MHSRTPGSNLFSSGRRYLTDFKALSRQGHTRGTRSTHDAIQPSTHTTIKAALATSRVLVETDGIEPTT